jgi:hypothetical protein
MIAINILHRRIGGGVSYLCQPAVGHMDFINTMIANMEMHSSSVT